MGWTEEAGSNSNGIFSFNSSLVDLHCRNGNSNKNRRHVSEGVKNMHRPYMAASMLVMEVSELHADMNGRLEITCLATIPAHVGPGEQFADYKTYSVKSKYREGAGAHTRARDQQSGICCRLIFIASRHAANLGHWIMDLFSSSSLFPVPCGFSVSGLFLHHQSTWSRMKWQRPFRNPRN